MATGGNIPTKRTQSVSFYNTTGVIERHKNIYYVPRIKYSNGLIKHAYMRKFEGVCPPSSLYTNIDISSWSPEDRTLRVKGNIDDFRCITNEGACLNYLIITRRVYSTESNYEEFYYAFFINKASQAGGSSILLELIPDDFTNVFYLHNNDTHSSDEPYDPFNKHMKNCYVNRQHYDRIEKNRTVAHVSLTFTENDPQGHLINLVYIGRGLTLSDVDNFEPTVTTTGQGSYVIYPISLRPSVVYYRYNSNTGYLQGNIAVAGIVDSFTIEFDINYSYSKLSSNKVFLNQEETFRFKYQYKDFKSPLNDYTDEKYFTKEEIQLINEGNTEFDDLPEKTKYKILDTCLHFLAIQTKSLELIPPIMKGYYNSPQSIIGYIRGRYTVGNVIENIPNPNATIFYPVMIVPSGCVDLSQYEQDINSFALTYRVLVNNIEEKIYAKSLYEISEIFSKSALADYIVSASIVKGQFIPRSFDLEENEVIFNLHIAFANTVPSGQQYVRLMGNSGNHLMPLAFNKDFLNKIAESPYEGWTMDDFKDYGVFIENDNGNLTIYHDNVLFGILHSGSYASYGVNHGILLNEKSFNFYGLRNIFFDPVLETSPYSFYSISFQGNLEMPLDKNKYYNGGSVSLFEFDYYESFTNGVLNIVLPHYNVEGKDLPYYNEALSFVSTNEMPLVSDSYFSYYYQNNAQMKNQFALADKNQQFDFWQQFLISGPNSAGLAAANKSTGWAALAETGNQVMDMVDKSVDWWQSKVNIDMNQKAKLADIGAKPDILKQAGANLYYTTFIGEFNLFLNHYTIDELSYNSIAKLLERTGYQVNLYDNLHVYDRKGYNFIKLNGFDYEAQITVTQEETIRKIFSDGVTLLHDKTYLTSGHNYEIILDE